MRQLAGRGIGIIFVTHFLDQVYAISDRITVLRNGRLVGERETSALPRLDLVHMMLGRELSEVTADREQRDRRRCEARPTPRSAVSASGAMWRRSISTCGAGRWWRWPACSARAAPRPRGSCSAPSAPIAARRRWPARASTSRSPREAIRLGFGYCPEERKTEGIVAELSVRENIVLALQARRGWIEAAVAPGAGRDRTAISSSCWISAPPIRNGRSGCCRAATSRRCYWRAGLRPNRAC